MAEELGLKKLLMDVSSVSIYYINMLAFTLRFILFWLKKDVKFRMSNDFQKSVTRRTSS